MKRMSNVRVRELRYQAIPAYATYCRLGDEPFCVGGFFNKIGHKATVGRLDIPVRNLIMTGLSRQAP
jgi:hypothetical protein